MRLTSIASRIIMLHVVALCAVSLLLPYTTYLAFNALAEDIQKQSLVANASVLARFISEKPDQSIVFAPSPDVEALFSKAYGKYRYTILDDKGKILFSTASPKEIIPSTVDLGDLNPHFLRQKSGDTLVDRILWKKQIGQRYVIIHLVENFEHRDALTDDFLDGYFSRIGWVSLPILLVLLLVDILIFDRSLSPLREVSAKAGLIGPKTADMRLPVDNLPSELVPLIDAVNQALSRLEAGYRAQREFTADAAHELRTPLSVLRLRVDTLADAEGIDAVRADVAHISRILSQLLEMSELDNPQIDLGERFDLNEIVTDIASQLALIAKKEGKHIHCKLAFEPVFVTGNAAMLERAVRNLMDNALAHSVGDSAVEIEVAAAGSISVKDRGPGISSDDRERVFQRFWRKERNKGTHAGLGLSIVARIVNLHKGSISVSDRPGGGSIFQIDIPLAPPQG